MVRCAMFQGAVISFGSHFSYKQATSKVAGAQRSLCPRRLTTVE